MHCTVQRFHNQRMLQISVSASSCCETFRIREKKEPKRMYDGLQLNTNHSSVATVENNHQTFVYYEHCTFEKQVINHQVTP